MPDALPTLPTPSAASATDVNTAADADAAAAPNRAARRGKVQATTGLTVRGGAAGGHAVSSPRGRRINPVRRTG